MEWSRLWWLLSVVVTEYVLVLAAVGADMASGISKSRKRGEATRSRSLRRTVDKLARYYNVLVVLTVVDAMQIAGRVVYARSRRLCRAHRAAVHASRVARHGRDRGEKHL